MGALRLKKWQRAEGGGFDGHVQQLGLQLGGSREPWKVFEQGRGAVKAALLQDSCGHSAEDRLEKLERWLEDLTGAF